MATISEIEQKLSAAQERLKKATQALAPKHKGGEVKEFNSAYKAVLSLERELAAARGEGYPIPVEHTWLHGAYVDSPCAAIMLDELKQYQDLIRELSEHIARGASTGAAYHNRALAYWETGEIDNALRDFNEAIFRLPKSHLPSQMKGMLLQQLGRFDEAISCLSRAVAISPDEATVRRTRAHLLVEAGRLEESLDDFNHAIRLEPAFTRTREDRDRVLSKLNRPRQEQNPKRWWQLWRE